MSADAAPVHRPIRELFTRSVSALWATTYNVDLALVNEFLLPLLGQPPLNVTVLADHRVLARTLGRIPPDRADTLAAVNRQWLLRGVRGAGPAFHPKSYLAVAAGRATLLVGSGNLSLLGLDEGREVFTAFRSGTPDGDRAIAVWSGWMRRLVADLGDPQVSARFDDLVSRLPAPVPGAVDPDAPRLAHDLDAGLLDQLAGAAGDDPVDELVVAAPFHDTGARALAALVDRFAPALVTVHVSTTTSVDGAALRRAVAGRDARFRRLDPDEYTHAKLVGVLRGERGWLLSGSANVSRAGLLAPVRERGNVELGVLAGLPAGVLRACFVPPGVTVADCAADVVDGLTAEPDEEPPPARVRLLRAELCDDGRVLVVSDPPPEPGWSLTDGERSSGLRTEPDGRTVTADPLAARLVRLADSGGTAISDAVVVDDPAALAAQLRDGGAPARRAAPPGLTDADLDTPVGRALARLDRELVMDVPDTTGTPGAGGIADGGTDTADDDFWGRLERERLASDPRAARYARLAGAAAGGAEGGALDELLERLRLRLGPEPGRAFTPGGPRDPADPGPDPAHPAPGRSWAVDRRRRLRMRNVFRRWSAGVADPRLGDVHPNAPEINFAVLTGELGGLTLSAAGRSDGVELTAADLADLWWTLLGAFCGTGRRDGYLDRFAPADADARVAALDPLVRAAAAWLCWLGVRPGTDHRARVVRHRTTLAAALDRGLLDPTDDGARCATVALGDIPAAVPTRAGMERDLLRAATFVDDGLWCQETADRLGLAELRFELVRDPRGTRTELHVRGLDDPLQDPRAPRLLLAAERHRGTGIVLRAAPPSGTGRRGAPGADWRLAHAPDEPLGYSATRSDSMIDSLVDLDPARLERMAEAGQPLATIFEPAG